MNIKITLLLLLALLSVSTSPIVGKILEAFNKEDNIDNFIHLNNKEEFEKKNIKNIYKNNLITRDWREFNKKYKNDFKI